MMRNSPGVPRARPGRAHGGRHAGLDLQLVGPRSGRVPGRPLRRRARHRRGRQLPRPLRAGPRGSCPSSRRSASSHPAEKPADFTWDDLIGAEPVDLAAAAAAGRPERPGHGHLHVGHHGPAEGRDDLATATPVRGREPPGTSCPSTTPTASGSCRTCPWPTSPSAWSATTRSWSWATRSAAAPSPGKIAAYCAEVRPHVLFGVPRVWEKIYAGLMGGPRRRPRERGEVRRGRRGRSTRSR